MSFPLSTVHSQSYVVKNIRSVYSVGCGLGGKLGHGSRTDEKHARLIEQFQLLNLQPVVVAAGAWHAAIVGQDGRVCTWGWGRYGCLGHGNEECESSPKVVEALSNVKAVHVATGDYTTFVVSDDGDVYSFGCGESASLGHNNGVAAAAHGEVSLSPCSYCLLYLYYITMDMLSCCIGFHLECFLHRALLEITTLHNDMILTTLSISSRGLALSFPKRPRTNWDSLPTILPSNKVHYSVFPEAYGALEQSIPFFDT